MELVSTLEVLRGYCKVERSGCAAVCGSHGGAEDIVGRNERHEFRQYMKTRKQAVPELRGACSGLSYPAMNFMPRRPYASGNLISG